MTRAKRWRPRRIVTGVLAVALVCVLAGAFLLRWSRTAIPDELVLEVGPYNLPAGAGHADVEQLEPHIAQVPRAGWLHGYRIELVDSAGRPVPDAVIHHVNLITPERRELFSQIMLRIGASGKETGEIRLPWFLGHPVERGQQIMVAAMLHNPTASDYGGVKLRIRMPFTPERRWLRPFEVFPIYLDVMPPAGRHAYDLEAGHSEQSWEGSPAVPGRLLGLGGHLHRYGTVLRLEDVTAGKVLWEAEPILDETGDVAAMPTDLLLWKLGIPLDPTHTYRLTAVYDNPTGQRIPLGAMGAMGGIFRPDRGAVWPAADTLHPEYLLDVQTLREGGYEEDSMHDHGSGADHVH